MDEFNILNTYDSVKNGTIKKFPDGTWTNNISGKYFFKICFLDNLSKFKWSREDLIRKIDFTTIKKWKLGAAIRILFDASPYLAIDYCIPEWKIKPWELKMSPQNSWNENSIKEAIRWVIDEKHMWGREMIVKNVSNEFLTTNGLHKVLLSFRRLRSDNIEKDRVKNGFYELLSFVYPEYEFKIWEFSLLKSWTKEDILCVFKQMVETTLNLNSVTASKYLKSSHFKEFGLYDLLKNYFNNDIKLVIDLIYHKGGSQN